MKQELIKELLGNKIDQCTDENFELGYDPITDLIDKLEGCGMSEFEGCEVTEFERICAKDWVNTEKFLNKMKFVTPIDENYRTIYFLDFYGNGFYYSKEAYDNLMNNLYPLYAIEFETGINRSYYYHILSNSLQSDVDFQQVSISYVPDYELENENYEIRCAVEQLVCELETKCIQSSDIPEIKEAECLLEEQWDEIYGWEYERELRRSVYWFEIEEQREREIAAELVCELENFSIEPDED